MAVVYEDEQERASLQASTGSTQFSLHDLRVAYYQGKIGTLWTQENDLVREYLIEQLGITGVRSLTDLWRLFLISKGITNQVSLGDMMRSFFSTGGFGSGSSTGQSYGLLLALTQA